MLPVSRAVRTWFWFLKEIDIDHVAKLLKYNYDHGKHYGIVVVGKAFIFRKWVK